MNNRIPTEHLRLVEATPPDRVPTLPVAFDLKCRRAKLHRRSEIGCHFSNLIGKRVQNADNKFIDRCSNEHRPNSAA